VLDQLRKRIAATLGRDHRADSQPDAAFATDAAIVEQVLDPAFLKARLEEVKEEGSGELSDERYEEMFAELDRAQASPVVGANPSQGGQAYLPRSAPVSMLQSTLTDCLTSRLEQLLEPLPPGHHSFGEFILRETDVFRQFGPCDAGWAESVISKGISALQDKSGFLDGRAPEVAIADNARLVVVGDWGTGLAGAQAVGREMAEKVDEARKGGREVHVLHLGDVYYSGWKEEYKARFMPYWPVRSAAEGVGSWALNGNHDMYSGGLGYFGYLLQDPRFAGHRGSSYFCLQNSNWQILGLDSSYIDSDLAGSQGKWVADKQRESARKTMLLTHHEPFSDFVQVKPKMLETLRPAFDVRPIDAWLWGHEHLCCVYGSDPEEYLRFGSCIGHGGVPVLLDSDTGGRGDAGDRKRYPVTWRATNSETRDEHSWQLFGFAVLDFDGSGIEVAYYDQRGGQAVNTARIE
jgi:Calcineurin-like phosphoesterase